MYEPIIENKVYAPVCIPTCNRYNKLKKCIESLIANKEAKKTELYISVDYPPEERFFSGYQETLAYVRFLEKNDSRSFKCVHAYYQDENIGAIENSSFLKEEVKKNHHECLIYTEDDNEFHHNALSFLNTGLVKYKNDNRVIYICPRNISEKDRLIKEKFILKKSVSVWGFAFWLKDDEEVKKWVSIETLDSIGSNISCMKKLFREDKGIFNCYVNGYLIRKQYPYLNKEGNVSCIDIYRSMHMLFNDKLAAYPHINMINNTGNDGSGLNAHKGDKTEAIISDVNEEYYINDLDFVVDTVCDRQSQSIRSYIRSFKTMALYIGWLLGFKR